MHARACLEDSRVFCLAPWTQLHVLTDGKVYPCCMSGHDARNAIGDLRAGDTLESAWNSSAMRALRRNMLAGTSSTLCERCYVNDDLGIGSLRTTENRQMAHHVHWVERTDASGALDTLNVAYLDFRVSNLCNLKCRICCHRNSSAWYEDAARLGLNAPGMPRRIVAIDDPDRLWAQVRPLIPSLEHVHFAGGEPLIMPEHYQLLNELIVQGKTDVRLTYNTNFLVLRYKTFDGMSMWKRFPSVNVSASLDGMGERGDYMRKGQRWDRIEANRARLLRECPHVEFGVSAAVSLMNVLHLPEFFRHWYEKGYVSADGMKMYLLFEPEYYSVQGLPADLKRRVEDLYGDFIETYLTPLGEQAAALVANFRAIVTHMNERDLDIAAEFRRVTIELDLLRNESFPETFPELADLATPTLVERARAHRRLGDIARSLQDCDEAITLELGNPDARAERGVARLGSGDVPGALADFAAAIELDPRHLNARLSRGVLLRARGEHAAGSKDFEVVLERLAEASQREEQRPKAWIERARIRRQCGDLDGALADFDRAFALASGADQTSAKLLPLILSERALVKRDLGDHAGSWQDFTNAVLLADGPMMYLDPAIAAVEHPGAPIPVRVQESLDLSHPFTPPLLYYSRGVVRRGRGEWELARQDFDRALELMPEPHALLQQLMDRMRQPAGGVSE